MKTKNVVLQNRLSIAPTTAFMALEDRLRSTLELRVLLPEMTASGILDQDLAEQIWSRVIDLKGDNLKEIISILHDFMDIESEDSHFPGYQIRTFDAQAKMERVEALAFG